MYRYMLIVLSAALSLGASNVALGAIISTFDSDDEDWVVRTFTVPLSGNPPTLVDEFPVVYNPIGGNPGGFISYVDVDPNLLFFSAPDKFLGDRSQAFGTNLSFDTKDSGGVNDKTELFLTGDGLTLYYKAGLDPSTNWTHFEIPLAPDNFWHLNSVGGDQPTGTEFANVLSSLDGLYILGDWIGGEDDTGFDNVRLVPEPSTALLAGLGLIGLLATRRRFAKTH